MQSGLDALGYRIVVRPVGTCIEARSKQLAAQMHLSARVVDVTDGQWATYFVDAFVYQSPDYGALVDKIKTKVLLDETDLDPERCHDKWMMAYWGLLERNNMMSFHEKHPKKAVKALVHGIRPLALKQLVKTQLVLDHKPLRNCVLSFFDFVKGKMRPRLELARAGAPGSSRSRKSPSGARFPRPKPTERAPVTAQPRRPRPRTCRPRTAMMKQQP